MENKTAVITFHSSEFFNFDCSKLDEVEYSESENRCIFKVPLSEKDPKRRTIQGMLDYFSIQLTRPAVPLVNGKPQDLTYILQPGDCVIMLFQISGG